MLKIGKNISYINELGPYLYGEPVWHETYHHWFMTEKEAIVIANFSRIFWKHYLRKPI